MFRRAIPRGGFTLIEILVAVGILLLLFGLGAGVYLISLTTGETTLVQTDLKNLDAACHQFRNVYGEYPPSSITLYGGDPSTWVGTYSAQDALYLKRIFKGIDLNRTGGHDWLGNGTAGAITLEGHECLFYFLGGVPTWGPGGRPFPSGFNADKADPTGTSSRMPPLFDFKTNYIQPSGTTGAFPWCYQDRYKTPIAYYKPVSGNFDPTHCSTIRATFGALPYKNAAGRWLKPESFQIISAGANRFFTPDGTATHDVYEQGANNQQYLTGANQDNLANFSDGLLKAQAR